VIVVQVIVQQLKSFGDTGPSRNSCNQWLCLVNADAPARVPRLKQG